MPVHADRREPQLAALVPGRADVLRLRGTAYVSDEPALLATTALKDKPPLRDEGY